MEELVHAGPVVFGPEQQGPQGLELCVMSCRAAELRCLVQDFLTPPFAFDRIALFLQVPPDLP